MSVCVCVFVYNYLHLFFNFSGIDMVKISDPEAAVRYNIINSPALVYFRKRMPLIYDGIKSCH